MRPVYRSSTASWHQLALLRRRGQKPAALFVTDDSRQRWNLEASGVFAVGLPQSDKDDYLVSGLDVVVIADFGEHSMDVARRFMTSSPRYFATYWRGRGLSVVIE